MNKNKFYVTTPIYYVNAPAHLGGAYTTIAADVLARYYRNKYGQENVFFMTGTDEHGAKIQESAEAQGKSPKQFTDEIVAGYKKTWKNLNISYDNFLRTTDKDHEAAVQWVVQKLFDQGDIYKGVYQALYCVGCEQYKTKSELIDNNICPDHNRPCEIHEEEAYLFRLSKYEEEIKNRIVSDSLKIRPETRKNEVLSFINTEGLEDIAVSRKKENVSWGVDLPFDNKHTIYVWVDAFLNYLTGLGWPTETTKADLFWPADIQLMAKDIMRVHATIWQAMLMALNLPTSKELFIHGYFTLNGKKMSKSLGNVLEPNTLIEKFGADTVRYSVLREFPFGQDGDISEEKITQRYISDLGNELGNLLQRTLIMINKYEVKVKKVKGNSIDIEPEIKKLSFDGALIKIWKEIKNANQHIEAKAPWVLAKTDKKQLTEVLEKVYNDLYRIADSLDCFMPETVAKINNQLECKKPEPLFPRMEK